MRRDSSAHGCCLCLVERGRTHLPVWRRAPPVRRHEGQQNLARPCDTTCGGFGHGDGTMLAGKPPGRTLNSSVGRLVAPSVFLDAGRSTTHFSSVRLAWSQLPSRKHCAQAQGVKLVSPTAPRRARAPMAHQTRKPAHISLRSARAHIRRSRPQQRACLPVIIASHRLALGRIASLASPCTRS